MIKRMTMSLAVFYVLLDSLLCCAKNVHGAHGRATPTITSIEPHWRIMAPGPLFKDEKDIWLARKHGITTKRKPDINTKVVNGIKLQDFDYSAGYLKVTSFLHDDFDCMGEPQWIYYLALGQCIQDSQNNAIMLHGDVGLETNTISMNSFDTNDCQEDFYASDIILKSYELPQGCANVADSVIANHAYYGPQEYGANPVSYYMTSEFVSTIDSPGRGYYGVFSYDTASMCALNSFDDEPYIANIRPTNVCLPMGDRGDPRIVTCEDDVFTMVTYANGDWDCSGATTGTRTEVANVCFLTDDIVPETYYYAPLPNFQEGDDNFHAIYSVEVSTRYQCSFPGVDPTQAPTELPSVSPSASPSDSPTTAPAVSNSNGSNSDDDVKLSGGETAAIVIVVVFFAIFVGVFHYCCWHRGIGYEEAETAEQLAPEAAEGMQLVAAAQDSNRA